ncbi:hypothetical protein IE53DRAFT_83717 [Violaceomyces palustris]|uniref:Uncharacterized protein n=1 Tax=Violaceomyces palustris TaxID=1673888 RepID=A0ACD0NXR4_9BASI|nr:hypothetical protein IE53DRAFT_83717 [Violaceomyces palustris]
MNELLLPLSTRQKLAISTLTLFRQSSARNRPFHLSPSPSPSSSYHPCHRHHHPKPATPPPSSSQPRRPFSTTCSRTLLRQHAPPKTTRRTSPPKSSRASKRESANAKKANLTLSEQEQLLKSELRQLEEKLEVMEKQELAKSSTQDLPELDEETLDQIYQALLLPQPSEPEQKRLARLEQDRTRRSILERAPSEDRRRIQQDVKQRLKGAALRSRLLLPESNIVPSDPDEATNVRSNGRGEEFVLEVNVENDLQSSVRRAGGDRLFDQTGLTYKERQELNLASLFQRLDDHFYSSPSRPDGQQSRLLDPSPRDGSSSSSKGDEISRMRKGLARRIAQLLEKKGRPVAATLASVASDSDRGAKPPSPDDKDGDDASLPLFKQLNLRRTGTIDNNDVATDGHHHHQRYHPSFQDHQEDKSLASSSQRPPASFPSSENDELTISFNSKESRTLMLDRIESILDRSLSQFPTSTTTTHPTSSSSDSNSPEGKTKDGRVMMWAAAAEVEGGPNQPRLPLGVVTDKEWKSLAVSSLGQSDEEGFSRTLKLMKRSGSFPPGIDFFNAIMDVYAQRGEVAKVQETLQVMERMGMEMDDCSHHCVVKSYLEDGSLDLAIRYINSLEERGAAVASMATYTMAIDRLSKDPREEIQALAWSLFYHMRLVAHPVPDAPLYALMISACSKGLPQPNQIDDPTRDRVDQSGALSNRADAERALDLFREMTTRYGVRPNSEVYNNLILTCSRRKDFYLDSFRLLREMVNLEEQRTKVDQVGDEKLSSSYLSFSPDRYTFNALLQGCCRNADLPRARWVLAEMIRSTMGLFEEGGPRGWESLSRREKALLLSKRPNEETLVHVLHSYASFKPRVKRGEMRIVNGDGEAEVEKDKAKVGGGEVEGKVDVQGKEEEMEEKEVTSSSTMARPSSDLKTLERGGVEEATKGSSDPVTVEPLTAEEAATVFTQSVPQTSQEIIKEARALMARIVADQPRPVEEDGARERRRTVEGPLGSVKVTPHLVNSYLSVLINHLSGTARFEAVQSALYGQQGEEGVKEGLYESLGLKPNANTLAMVLESCEKEKDRSLVEGLVERVWKDWRKLERSQGSDLDPRVIERCWRSYVHNLSKSEKLSKALGIVKRFTEIYPPPTKSTLPLSKTFSRGRGSRVRTSGETFDEEQSRVEEEGERAQIDLSPFPIPSRSYRSLRKKQVGEEKKEEKEEKIQPLLTFFDLELLHHRLIRLPPSNGGSLNVKHAIQFLGWVSRAYVLGSRNPPGSSPNDTRSWIRSQGRGISRRMMG